MKAVGICGSDVHYLKVLVLYILIYIFPLVFDDSRYKCLIAERV